MNCIVNLVRRYKLVLGVVVVPIVSAIIGAYVSTLIRSAPEIAFDIHHKIQDQVHSFSFTIRNKGSENIKQGESVEMILLFRSNITKLIWYPAVSKDVIEDECRGREIKGIEDGRKININYYYLKIKKMASKAELKFTIESNKFLENMPYLAYEGKHIEPNKCESVGFDGQILCDRDLLKLNRIDVDLKREKFDCPFYAPIES